MRFRARAIALLAIVGGCASDEADAPAYTPVFAAAACPAPLPADPAISCGTLAVPESRARPDGPASSSS